MSQTSIKKVLMCEPLHFSSLDYSINPWMTFAAIDNKKALRQWKKLVKIYQDLGIQIETIEQHKKYPDMVFATDQGIIQKKTVVLSRFKHTERKGESELYEQWFRTKGYATTHLPEDVYFEGNGNALFWNDSLFIGLGYRADEKTHKQISKIFDQHIVPLEVVNPKFYHLDVGFFPLNKETIFYYPPAFSEKSRGVLKKLVPNLIEFSDEEAYGFAANSIVTGNHVIHQKNNSFRNKLEKLGYTSEEVDMSEFMKSGGGIHCLTNVLE